MSASADSMTSSASRSLRLRLRADLVVREQSYQGRAFWIVKDPLSLKYFRFEEEEYALLTWLDGCRSLDELRAEFERRFAPQKISLQEIHQFVGSMHKASIVLSDAAGQGDKLLNRKRKEARRERWAMLSNILCIRFHGFDPDRLLSAMNRCCGWLFSTPALAAACLLALVALTTLLTNFSEFQARLPGFHEFFAAQNWLWLAATLAMTKVLHEFGHGLACKKFGGECHEMGVMFLVFTPCLYCNVSDSWLLPSKRRRAAIGAAGMYFEIVLASLCTLIWWRTQPGMINYLCLNIMFVSSVSTILFNANPLMRYDGYYILSDLVEIPNLRQKATSVLRRKAAAICLGLPEPHDPFLPTRWLWLFALYSVLAFFYRWIVVFSILWLLYSVLEPYGLQALGQALVALSLYGLIVQPLVQLYRHLSSPGRIDQVSRVRLGLSAVVVVALAIGVLFVPTRHYVYCHLHLRPRGASPVYVEVDGRLKETHVQAGQAIAAGEPVATLSNIDLDHRVLELEGRRDQLAAQAETANQLALLGDDSAALEWEEITRAIETLQRQIDDHKRDRDRLIVRSTEGGVVMAGPYRPKPTDRARLATWSGQAISKENVGATFGYGQLLCYVGDPNQMEAILLVEQDDVKFVEHSQFVDVVLDRSPGDRIRTKIADIAKRPARRTPASLSGTHGGPIPSHPTNELGAAEPMDAYYEASAPVDLSAERVSVGALGRARIHVGSRTIGQWLLRSAQQLIR